MDFFSCDKTLSISVICVLFLSFSSAAYSKKYQSEYDFDENVYNELKTENCKKGSGALYKSTFNKLYNLPRDSIGPRLQVYVNTACWVDSPKIPALGITQCEGDNCRDRAATQRDYKFNGNNTHLFKFENGGFSLRSDILYNNSICYTGAVDRKKFTSKKGRSKADKAFQTPILEAVSIKCIDWHISVIEDVTAKIVQDKKDKIAAAKQREKDRLAAEKKRKADKLIADKERKADKLIADKKRKADELKRAADAKISRNLKAQRAAELEKGLALPSDNRAYMVWSKPATSNNNKKKVLSTDSINLINLSAWNKVNNEIEENRAHNRITKPVYSAPVLQKGEFEKSSNFKTRKKEAVALAKAKYDNNVEMYKNNISEINKENKELIKNKDARFIDIVMGDLSSYLGDPKHTLKYDADKESYLLTVNSKTLNGYVAKGKIPMPIDQAPVKKAALQNGKMRTVYKMVDGKLLIQRIVLETDERVYRIDNVTDNIGRYVFTEAAANKFRPKYEASLKRAEDNRQKKVAAERALKIERQDKYRKEQVAKRKDRERKYGHSGPFLNAGATMCTEYKSMYKALAVARANNPYVPIPGDCILSTPKMVPITNVKNMASGISNVILKSKGISVYVTSGSITE